MKMQLKPLTLKCPCGTEVDVPIECAVRVDDGRQFLDFHPDYTDLWAHAWTHDTEVDFDFPDSFPNDGGDE